MKIVACSLEPCIHNAGIFNFLNIAERLGYEAIFLGTSLSIDELLLKIEEYKPDLVGVSFRLTPEVARNIFSRLKKGIKDRNISTRFILGATPSVARVAEEFGIFDAIFTGGESPIEVVAYLKGEGVIRKLSYPQTLLERIEVNRPYPILRHHFGLPSLEDTIKGVREIAEAKVLDVISIGPDQNAQESFFRPEEMKEDLSGAGGVPIRSKEDLERIYSASRTGNLPLLRCYSGTRDLIRWGELLQETIKNAWAAIPLCWYSVLDKRSNRPLIEAIKENQSAMRWHAERGIPVEVNEAHHWGLRDAPDVVTVASAFLSAYNAKAMGVRHYIAQLMLNTPPSTSGKADLGKMLAVLELLSSLEDEKFTIYRQIRTGLASLSSDMSVAKGQLASSIQLGLTLSPHIVHVVGFSEGDHAATPSDVIESCKIAQGVIRNFSLGFPNLLSDEEVIARKEHLVKEAKILILAIKSLGTANRDPLTDPEVIAKAIKIGLLDAPHLKGNPSACGKVKTRIINGGCDAVDDNGLPISEEERISRILDDYKKVYSSLQ
ncbi:cobalamin B12-binding domain-containing protein [bacterium]|nr:cobalamin B12-binding domain-containing protein [bacterium]